MSILHFPRVNFNGIISVNPCTANNDDVMPTVVQRDRDSLGTDTSDLSEDNVIDYMRTTRTMENYSDPTGQKPFPLSGWNLSGDHSVYFRDTTVSSIIMPDGSSVTSSSTDALIGSAFNVTGSKRSDGGPTGAAVMVDLDATGLVTTQIFVGGINFMSGGNTIFQSYYDARMYQNWLNFQSTVSDEPYAGEQNFVSIGTVMQFVIPPSALPDYASLGFQSPGLEALLNTAKQEGGVAVRIRMMEMEPAITDATLQSLFASSGQWPINPAYGYLVGTIGVHYNGEPESEPAGRKLITPYPRATMNWKSPNGTVNPTPGGTVPWAPNDPNGSPTSGGLPPALIGNAVAALQDGSAGIISVDMVESFPKYGYRNPNGPPQDPPINHGVTTPVGFDAPQVRANVGQLELAVVSATDSTKSVSIGAIDYGLNDYSVYENFGGIQDISFNPSASGGDVAATLLEAIQQGNLVIRGVAGDPVNPSTELLTEDVIRVVTDDRVMYTTLNQANAMIQVKVYERGGPTTSAVNIYPLEYKNIIQIKEGSNDTCTSEENEYRPNQTTEPRYLGEMCNTTDDTANRIQVNYPDQNNYITIPAGEGYSDWFNISITPVVGGAALLNLQFNSEFRGQGVPAWSDCNYCSIRVFDDEDYSGLPRPLQWNDVYENTLRYYYLVYPAMSTVIPLNKESSVTSPYSASLIEQRLHTPDQAGFYSTLNMPITRTMSPSKINLLLEFLRQQTGS